jgi:hypothetical protein
MAASYWNIAAAYDEAACPGPVSQSRRAPIASARAGVAQPLNRGLAMAVLKKFPRFNIQFTSLKSRIKFCEVRPRFKCQMATGQARLRP